MRRTQSPPRHNNFRPTLTQLEGREVPAVYAVGMLSPAAGDAGDSAATFSGGIALDPALPTQAGKAVVTAATPTAAISAALMNTVVASFQGQSAGYDPDASTVSTSTSAHLPFVVTTTSTPGQYRLLLEDLANMPGLPADWDYNDRSWTVTVTELTAITVTSPAPAEESADGSRPIVLTLTRSNSTPGSLDQPLYLPFTLSGTATPGLDYDLPTANIAVFWPGESEAKIVLPVKPDTDTEGPEEVVIDILPPVGPPESPPVSPPGPPVPPPPSPPVSPPVGQFPFPYWYPYTNSWRVPIYDPGVLPPVPPVPPVPPASPAPALPQVWVSGSLDGEERPDGQRPVVFQLSRTNPKAPSEAPALSAGFSLSGVATPGADYTTPPTYTATFAPGQLTTTVVLNVLMDELNEGAESAILTISPSSSYTIGGVASGTADIFDYGTKPVARGVGDRVWLDDNDDGLQTPGEVGVAGVTVQLLSGQTVIAQTVTDANGRYWFPNVAAAEYRLKFVNPDPYQYYFPGRFVSGNPQNDNDADTSGMSPFFQVPGGGTDPTRDAAIKKVEIKLIGDTDRDGKIDETKDEKDKDKWDSKRGAVYAVNHDDSDGDKKPDAIDFGDNGKPKGENFKFENQDDADQSAPLLVKVSGPIPDNTALVIKVADLWQVASIHLFDGRKANSAHILGTAQQRIDPTAPNPKLDNDITQLMKNAKAAGHDSVELGVEGLVYRYVGAKAPGALWFGGSIDFTLELQDTTKQNAVIATQKVKMKVAPWMMMSNAQASKQVFAVKADSPAHKPDNDALRAALGTTNQLVAYDPVSAPRGGGGMGVKNSWAQDHAEIGYTQQPGFNPILATLQLPYSRHAGPAQPEWVRKHLLANKMGLFQLGDSLGGGGGDFGGNVELMPPDTKHPLGVIVVGDKISPALKQFFDSQEVQTVREVTQPTAAKVGEVLVLPSKWLGVGHVDEMLSFDKVAGKVVIADPEATYTMLKNKLTAAEQDAGLFFATGKTQAGAVNAEVVAGAEKDYRIETPNIDHTLPAATKFKYIRIVSGAAKGQIAKIVNWKKDYFEVGDVWNTTSNLVSDKTGAVKIHSLELLNPAAQQAGKWFVRPKAGDKFILMEDSKLNEFDAPMAFSLREMLADPNFEAVNSATLVAGQIDLARKLIKSVNPTIEFVSVPTLYLGHWKAGAPGTPAPDYVEYSVAFNPGLGNFQIVNGKYFVPQPFAPKYANGKDLFEEEVKDKLGAADVVFVDDWSFYHLNEGEVHCGTLVQREVLPVDWWVNLKANP